MICGSRRERQGVCNLALRWNCDNINGVRSNGTAEKSTRQHSAALLTEAVQAANDDHISVDEWVRDAMERRLRERRRQDLYAYGQEQARKLGIKEEDVERIIHEFREENRSGNERGH
jgi:hypothetical protein